MLPIWDLNKNSRNVSDLKISAFSPARKARRPKPQNRKSLCQLCISLMFMFKCFPSVSMHPHQLGSSENTDSDSEDLEWDPGFCISNKFPGDADSVSLGSILSSKTLVGDPYIYTSTREHLRTAPPTACSYILERLHLTTQLEPTPTRRGRYHQGVR